MRNSKAFLAALSAICIAFSAFASALAVGDEPAAGNVSVQDTGAVSNKVEIYNDEGYVQTTTFSWAQFDAIAGDTVKLISDVTVGSSSIEITSQNYFGSLISFAKDVTLDLNGYDMEFIGIYGALQAVNLTIIDSSAEKTGEIIADHQAFYIKEKSSVTLEGVTVESANTPVPLKDDPTKGTKYGTIINEGVLNIVNSKITGGYEAIETRNDGDVTINGEDTDIQGPIFVHHGAGLTVNNGKIQSDDYNAIYGNGSSGYGDTNITINGGEIISTDGTGIYLPQSGNATITGGTITGKFTAVEIVSGNLTITGGELISTANEGVAFRDDPAADGAQYYGAALAVVGRSEADGSSGYTGDINVNISGGNFTGPQAMAVVMQKTRDEQASIENITITGGNFVGFEIENVENVGNDNLSMYVGDTCSNKALISGGTFNTDITPYMADGTAYRVTDGEYTVYSADNKITGAGTYTTLVSDDTYDQLTTATKEITGTTKASDISFNVAVNGGTPQTYNYKGTTEFTNATVLFGLVVTDIPADKTVTVEMK